MNIIQKIKGQIHFQLLLVTRWRLTRARDRLQNDYVQIKKLESEYDNQVKSWFQNEV